MTRQLDQSAIIDFLKNPTSHGLGGGDRVEHIETHASHVFLAGTRAFKMKKRVVFPYLDFSTQSNRLAACRKELSINRQFTTLDIYCGLGAVRKPNTSLMLEENVEDSPLDGMHGLFEPIVVMNRFDTKYQLDHIAQRGEVNGPLADRLGDMVAKMVERAVPRAIDWSREFVRVVDESLKELSSQTAVFPSEEVATLSHLWAEFFQTQDVKSRLEARNTRVRRCHGDLHLRNIVMINNKLSPFDALEFDEGLATTDVLYELSFLMMDLIHNGLGDAAVRAASIAVPAMNDFSAVGLLPAYVSARAMVRAKVSASEAGQVDCNTDKAQHQSARRYLKLASDIMEPETPCLIAVGGLSGSGKSTLAISLSKYFLARPIVLRSDVLRKQIAGVDIFDAAPQEHYMREATHEVYDRLLSAAKAALEGGASVILDATFSELTAQAACHEVAKNTGVAFHGIWLDVSLDQRITRLDERNTDVSDANADIARRQKAPRPEGTHWRTIDATQGRENVFTSALNLIFPDRKVV